MDRNNPAYTVELPALVRVALMSEADWGWIIDRYFAGRWEGYELWEAHPENV